MIRKVYYNGSIITMRGENDYAEAVLTEGDRILKVGTKKDCLPLADVKVDLEGRTLLPGFIDSHGHFSQIARNFGQVNLFECQSIDELLKRVNEFAVERKVASGKMIIGRGYDHNKYFGDKHPTREQLDALGLPNPIMVVHKGTHFGVCSSLALQRVKIHDWFGHMMGVDETGKPNGYFEERAFASVKTQLGFYAAEIQPQYLRRAQDLYLSHGITTVHDSCITTDIIPYERAAGLSVDLICFTNHPEEEWHPKQISDENYVNRVRFGGYKLILDGNVDGHTAYFLEKYNDRDSSGYPLFTQEEMDKYVRQSIEDGRQIYVHCVGDASAESFLSAYEKAIANGNRSDLRPVMLHANFASEEQLKRMAKIPMIASFIAYDGSFNKMNRYTEVLGKDRANRNLLISTAIKNHVPYTLHRDAPVSVPDMLNLISACVNRQDIPQEEISVYEALAGITINGAWQYFEENDKGTIEKGKRADFVLLDENPLTVKNMAEIAKIKVCATIKDGETVWSAEV